MGRTYLVGERGPELFTPKRSGSITPNHQLTAGAGGGQTIHLTLDLGEGIQEVVEIKLREHDRNLKRTYKSGGRRAVATVGGRSQAGGRTA